MNADFYLEELDQLVGETITGLVRTGHCLEGSEFFGPRPS